MKDALIQSLHLLLRRGLLMGAALLVAVLGAGFLLLAGFVALRHAFGMVPAALIMGTSLLLLAAALVLAASNQVRPAPPLPDPPPPTAKPADPATMAAFTTAFVLGRYLAGRKRD